MGFKILNQQRRSNKISRSTVRTASSTRPRPTGYHLQTTIGNSATSRLLTTNHIQAKLTVSNPGDAAEREADRVAGEVMRMREPQPGLVVQRPPLSIQRKCTKCEETLKPQPTPDEEEKVVQANSADTSAGSRARSGTESYLNTSPGPGQPLLPSSRAYFEPRFGRDFSKVRIHKDRLAVESAGMIQARAFTFGQDIVFGHGEYAPETSDGQRLLAHELTHVVQQNGEGMLRKCNDCEAEQDKKPLIQTKLNTSTQNFVQRVHLENGRKKFDCPDFSGDSKLEACLNDEDRLRPFDTGDSVTKIQIGLQKDGQDLGEDGTKGSYGADTGQAVMAFKRKHSLGSTQFPDVGPGTTAKLDQLCVGVPKPEKPKLPKPDLSGACGPATANPFCLPIPAPDAPCKPFSSIAQAEAVKDNLSATIPLLTTSFTGCREVKPVWETYFAGTSTPFSFSNASSCVVAAAKTDAEGSDVANRAARGHLQDILDNLPITLRDGSPFPFPLGGPIAVRRLPLEDAIGPHGPFFLHPPIVYNNPFNAAANIAGGVGVGGQGSDIFGDDDRVIGGTVIIKVNSIDPISGMFVGQVRWQPRIQVKDTVDFCPGGFGNSVQREFTIPMSKLEAMGLTRDVPITIDYNLDVQQSDFNVLPLIGPLRSNP
jgi:hypothetical protein